MTTIADYRVLLKKERTCSRAMNLEIDFSLYPDIVTSGSSHTRPFLTFFVDPSANVSGSFVECDLNVFLYIFDNGRSYFWGDRNPLLYWYSGGEGRTHIVVLEHCRIGESYRLFFISQSRHVLTISNIVLWFRA